MTGLPPPREVHFVQQSEGPVFIGIGAGTLVCGCGTVLIQDYDPARFLSVGIQCRVCGALTTTPPLPRDAPPPFAVVIAEPVAEVRPVTTTLPRSVFVIGRGEMDRITALYQPATPADNVYRFSTDLLDQAVATHDRLCGAPLAIPEADFADPYRGLRQHALAWAVGQMRARMRQPAWRCLDDVPTSIASVHVTSFLHFVAVWGHHPLFPAMLANVAARGFSSHGLAPFAAAQVMTTMGNRITFPRPSGTPPLVDGFSLATGPTETIAARVEPFDRFEVPFGQPWDQTALRTAVAERIAASAARINPRNHGLLLLSPGPAMSGFDETLIGAIRQVVQAQGRKHRGLMAAGLITLRLQATPDPHAVRCVYGLFPVQNKHYDGDTQVAAAR